MAHNWLRKCWLRSYMRKPLTRRRAAGILAVTFFLTWTLLESVVLEQWDLTTREQRNITTREQRDITTYISDFFKIYRDPFINLHQYEFSLNSNVCDSKNLSILIIVHSKPDFYKKRLNIRTSFGTVKRVGNTGLGVVFMLGRVYNQSLQWQIQQESSAYNDIVQGNFIDNYKNMTHKHVMVMHWEEKQCPNVKVIVKIDDDVLINPYNLVKYINTQASLENSFHCMVMTTEVPDRNSERRYHIPFEQYPFKKLPVYCPGFAYITVPDVYRKLYRVSRNVRYLNMDDVYVTGVLALNTGVKRFDISRQILDCGSHSWFNVNDVIFVLNEQRRCGRDLRDIWRQVKVQ